MRFGRYELVERIGAGGMAEVFLAIQRGPRGVAKRLVIKRIAASRAHDPQCVALFEQEARVGCDLTHSNLVSVFDFGRVADHWFIAMEHVAGCDLGMALHAARERGAPVSAALVAYVAAEVCRGLAHLHARGYIHRDVTPRNVLLSWDGLVKLADYGLAIPDDRDGDRRVRGTRSFMAPEQAAAAAVDRRSDLYSVGAMIAHAGTADARLAAIAAVAMARDPAARFGSAEEMRAALAPIAAGVDDRTVAAWLGTLCPREDPAVPSAADPASMRIAATAARQAHTAPQTLDLTTPFIVNDHAPGALTPLEAPRTIDLTTVSVEDDRAPGALTPLEALLASSVRRRRRRGMAARAAIAAVLCGGALALGGGDRLVNRASAGPTSVPAQCRDGDGYYCGSTMRRYSDAPAGTFDDNTLYQCTNGRASVKEVCLLGCEIRPPAEADICQWRVPRSPKPSHATAPPGAPPPPHE